MPIIRESRLHWVSPEMPNVSDPLQELRDVHLPDPISWWPPAYGWWAVLAMIVLGFVVVFIVRAFRQRTRSRRVALAQLKHVKQQYAVHSDDQRTILQVSHILRRFALSVFARPQVAGLSGQSWLKFLDRTGGTNQFSEGPGKVLRSSPYQLYSSASAKDLLPLAERWIQRVQAPARKPAS